jgi:hypothetical protein
VSSAELAGASQSSGAPLLPGVPGHLSGFRWYQAEEEEIRELFCYTIIKLCFIYAAPPSPLSSLPSHGETVSRRKMIPTSVPVRLA